MGIVFESDDLQHGVQNELAAKIPNVIETCKSFGLDPFELVIEEYNAEEIAELAAYGGLPVRYPHFSFGQQYEEIYHQYTSGQGKIFEMVINNSPTYIYLQRNNPLVDNLTVVAHALSHSDFFKNNIVFANTNRNMMNVMALHGMKIRKYMEMHGRKVVMDFLNACLAVDDLIDPSLVWRNSNLKKPKKYDFDERPESKFVPRIAANDYMDTLINPRTHIDKERKRIDKEKTLKDKRFPAKPERDVMLFLINYAPLKPWQQNILSMVRDEALYYRPQGMTKLMNEGWAAYWDSHIMTTCGFAGDNGIFDYAKHHAGVLGGKYNMGNPYKLGVYMFNDIKERWDKGQFGREWEECDDYNKKTNWNKHLNLGNEKIFDVREYYNDVTFINEFFTKDFCHKYKFFEYALDTQKNKYVVVSKNYKKIKEKLMKRHENMGRPIIYLDNLRYKNNEMLLVHEFDGRPLEPKHAKGVLLFMYRILKRPVNLKTTMVKVEATFGGGETVTEEEVIYRATSEKDIETIKNK